MLCRSVLLVGVLVLVAATWAISQQPRGPGRGGFGPPPGPGGGGEFGPPGSGPPPLLPLLGRPEVQEELSLNADQRRRVDELLREFDFGPSLGGSGPPGWPGGPGGPGGPERKLVADFDKNGDGWLSAEERKAARQIAATSGRGRGRGGPPGGFPGGPGGKGGPGFGPGPRREEPGSPGPRVSPADVQPIADAPLYDPHVLRTLFLDFENDDWEAELEDFHGTDVDVPATLIVDGQKFPNVGVRFRGMSSYMAVPRGSKRSLNVAIDMADNKQRLYGYKTLNLLNAHEDDSLMHTVLYSHIARQYIPAPKANFVKVVINGESWGVYVNAQQFDKILLAENYPSSKGTRWKVSGNPGARGGLEYIGEEIEGYRRRYEMKSENSDKAWRDLIKLCRTLNETPPEQLEMAIAPLLDIDGTLRFLALDNTLINGDGYWVRASDYSIFKDDQEKFHVIPHDMNEAFGPAMGPGMGPPGGPGRGGFGGFGPPGGPPPGPRDFGGPPGFGGPGGDPRGGGFNLDPLIGLDDPTKPLRSKLLAVPSLRTRYLQHVRTIAKQSLDWQKLGPVVRQFTGLIEKEVAADTRKLSSLTAFQESVAEAADRDPPRGRRGVSLALFARERRAYLVDHPEIKTLPSP